MNMSAGDGQAHHGAHGGEGAGHVGHHHHGGCSGEKGPYSVGLHVAGVFVLLVASLVGTLIPLAGKYVPCLQLSPFMFVLGKCAATGVVLAVSLLTMVHHSMHSFAEECVPKALNSNTYDAFALLFAMIAAMLMHLFDAVLDGVLQSWAACDAGAQTSTTIGEQGGTQKKGGACGGACGMEGCGEEPGPNCETGGCCQNRGALAAARLNSARRVAAAVLMEFGLASHSVFLGLSVGIASDTQMRTLLIALSFHQLLEGVALGSRLVEASMSVLAEVAMTLIFSVSVPLGIAIGLITMVGTNSSMTGPAFVTLQGVVNALGGGMLLYIAFSLIFNDFPADMRSVAGPTAAHGGWKRCAMFAAFWGGTGAMAVLANWH
ncbi:cation transporter [Trypanosoma conorhini]|uniref:Cation transporter n=1 Tax=Trypanosoma conorhini TaxID=83891 RepID=A0A3R7KQ44_9TRYP|nr:cation transporter [Trypanosoma conorhini]RNE99161.1 cation transporter [Trypanosoma conorhini]